MDKERMMKKQKQNKGQLNAQMTKETIDTLKDNFFLDSGCRAMTRRLPMLRMEMMTTALMAPGSPSNS